MNAMELKGKDLIAYRTARLFQDGDVVNLGIGMPTKCLDYLPEGVDVWVDFENGVVGLTGCAQGGRGGGSQCGGCRWQGIYAPCGWNLL